MKRIIHFLLINCLIILLPKSVLAGGGHSHGHGHTHGHSDEHEHVNKKGVHGGKLFNDGEFAVEVTIFEQGVPPQFRIYAYQSQKALAAKDFEVIIKLTRFGNVEEQFKFEARDDYRVAAKTVEEPHSFEVEISANFKGKNYHWSYDSFEGRTELSESALKVANIQIERVAAQELSNSSNVYGRLLTNEDRVAHVYPRYSGVVKQIVKTLGQKVEQGDVLAVIESNQSLQVYEVRSQVSGVVLKRHATLGEFVTDSREIFVVADLSEIWADFQLYRDDFGPISQGQRILIDIGDRQQISATLNYASPVIDEATQSRLIRAVLPNQDGKLKPGLFVSGTISSAKSSVPMAVRREAIQSFRDWDVVYLTDGHVFQAMPVELGRRDAQFVEVLSGIKPGMQYVTKNSFIIKADIEKSGASHDH